MAVVAGLLLWQAGDHIAEASNYADACGSGTATGTEMPFADAGLFRLSFGPEGASGEGPVLRHSRTICGPEVIGYRTERRRIRCRDWQHRENEDGTPGRRVCMDWEYGDVDVAITRERCHTVNHSHNDVAFVLPTPGGHRASHSATIFVADGSSATVVKGRKGASAA